MDTEQDAPDSPPKRTQSPTTEEIIVRADEVDEAGADISAITSTDDHELEARVEARRLQDLRDTGSPKTLANATTNTIRSPVRPILRREGSAPPPPPRQPPPPAPPVQHEDGQQPTDSLSLGQLRNLVANFPKLEPTAYAYTYKDTRTLPEELEEWFQYTDEDGGLVSRAKESFEEEVNKFDFASSEAVISRPCSWLGLSAQNKRLFVKYLLSGIGASDASCLESLTYLATGVWAETAGKLVVLDLDEERDCEPPNQKYKSTIAQLRCIEESSDLLCDLGAPRILFGTLKDLCEGDGTIDSYTGGLVQLTNGDRSNAGALKDRKLNSALTTLYFLVEAGREQARKGGKELIRQEFVALGPDILEHLSLYIARLRWDDESSIPFTKVMLLLWKATLLIFGSAEDLNRCKKVLRKDPELEKDKNESVLTASPLDYHLFRQEITSKYPAYSPPQPLVPLEINNNSILPPLPNHLSRDPSHDDLQSLGPSGRASKSIFHQPVHIATPAPSPPPSPAGPGGKGGKKQNYQTNQNFPFLYPPLDKSSNDLGGKGKAGLQDRLVGKRWEGSDIPASILEAGELFASRMRISRPLRQLWEVREEFVKYERGWEEAEEKVKDEGRLETSLENMDLESDSDPELLEDTQGTKTEQPQISVAEKECEDEDVQTRLDAVEAYFRKSFPHLQSVIVVLLKILLSNITMLGSLNSGPNGMVAPTDFEDIKSGAEELPKFNFNLCRQLTGMANGQHVEPEAAEQSLEDFNAIRTREITSKAISAFLLTLLKWFRLSHVLKFEYTTQLLLDSNYLPLALKYFALQDVDRAVDLRHDRNDLDFFQLCSISAGNPQLEPLPQSPPQPPSSSSSSDSAAPPPIARNRPVTPASSGSDISASSSPSPSPPPSPGSPTSPPRRPEVDELGYPTTALPTQPLTNYAPRFFHTYISTLRVLQKLTKNHAHRALILVQYKSSAILRKALKVPQPALRLYTLKLFKTQVPYCGRKWRQANMRVITAIYVFCRMGLRDEWISGGGNVEDQVEGAVPTERAWRGLVGWWLGRRYRDVVAGNEKKDGMDGEESIGADGSGEAGGSSRLGVAQQDDDDFFTRELEKMGWGYGVRSGEERELETRQWWEEEGEPIQVEL